ncbi:hypothetical protein F2P44_23090 [Massilia sp. CCM 8695]|uniref:Uncharacterized protein n=1 Tax=Massilia frigida TaxID=2609281 RepID=A0ABX0N9N1_9BURK|nr:hypothetical protein [Massilia frigida]NHZ82140.1 hypothetical protein [Massilia frigida]
MARVLLLNFDVPRMTIPTRAPVPCLWQCRIGVNNGAASRSASRAMGSNGLGREQLSASNSDD